MDMNGKGGRIASIALWPDPEIIGLAEDFLFKRREFRIRVWRADVTKQGALGQQRRLLECSANPDSGNQRRAGVRPGISDTVENKRLRPCETFRRSTHLELTAVFTATALGHQPEAEPVAGHELGMDHGRRVIARIRAAKGTFDNGGAQIALGIAGPHPGVNGVLQQPAVNMQVLSDIGKTDDKPGVLAVRQPLGPSNPGILLEHGEDFAAGRRALRLSCTLERSQHVRAQLIIRFHTQPGNRVGDLLGFKSAHDGNARQSAKVHPACLGRGVERGPSWREFPGVVRSLPAPHEIEQNQEESDE